MHNSSVSSRIYVPRFRSRSSHYHGIRIDRLYVTFCIVVDMLVGRFFLTPGKFSQARWNLGKWSRPMIFITLIWNLYAAAVLFSPISFPVTNETFNYSCVIFGAITIFAFLCWWWMPEDEWLRTKRIVAVIDANS
jgi:hypothetical protein